MDQVLVILSLSFLIAFHELGHLLMALLTGIPIERFSMGFGPKLISRRFRGIEFRISMIPIGGYVLPRMDDIDDLYSTPKLKRILFSLGGPAFNILLTWVLLVVISAMSGGVTVGSILIDPIVLTFTMCAGILLSFGMLVKDPSLISGMVGMAAQGGEFVSGSFQRLMILTAYLSANLAIFNLLPIPALDGGKVLFTILEKISIKIRKIQVPVTVTSFILLIGLMIFSTIMDILKLTNITL